MTVAAKAGRRNQMRRTRKDLLQAAARLIRQGRTPRLEEIAEEAMVSRATAYRYFPDLDALLVEASLDIANPDIEDLLRDAPADDPVERLARVDAAFEKMIAANEPQLRTMLAYSVRRAADGGEEFPARQNRRTPAIEAALEPLRARFEPRAFGKLKRALALVIGTESMLVFKDVLQVDETAAREVRRWAIRALVDAARKRNGQAKPAPRTRTRASSRAANRA